MYLIRATHKYQLLKSENVKLRALKMHNKVTTKVPTGVLLKQLLKWK